MGKKEKNHKEETGPTEKPKRILVKSPYLSQVQSDQDQTATPSEPAGLAPAGITEPEARSERWFKSAVLALSATTAALSGFSVEMAPPQGQSFSSDAKTNDVKVPTSSNALTTVTITYPAGEHVRNVEISQSPWQGNAEHQPHWDGSTSTLKFGLLGAAYLKALEPVFLEIIKRHREAKPPKSEGRGVSIDLGDKVISVENAKDLDRAIKAAEALEGSKRAAHK